MPVIRARMAAEAARADLDAAVLRAHWCAAKLDVVQGQMAYLARHGELPPASFPTQQAAGTPAAHPQPQAKHQATKQAKSPA